ncbi:PASTA domain-containing protein [Ruminococcus flavefaciens]|uniref:PASTA domain-containing protein n=1 Tax=Ruminococcus flavefaciens TaxID=1265 RepID=A0A1H6KT60_RUMFL|nr:PASTA domain-containing protein [Ruminococcus flavefaciens]SEH79031.1 PASTA domain-containing protein [Ruminococcus flavefaciens]
MNDKEFDLTMLENADNETIKQIAENCPASDEEMERMFAMSRKIYNERTRESNNKDNIEVSGVEQYRKPVWQKFTAVAAALVLTGGVVAGGMYFMKNKNNFNTNDPVPVVTDPATSPSTQPASPVEEGCPFGDISNDKVRVTYAAISPGVVDVKQDFVKQLAENFNKGKWTELSDAPQFMGEYSTIFIYNNGNPYQVDCCLYNTENDKGAYIKFNDGKDLKYYKGDEFVVKAVQGLYSYDFDMNEVIKLDESDYDDLIHKVWADQKTQANTEEVTLPDVKNMKDELAKAHLKDMGLNVEIVKSADITVNPGYVIKSEPDAGTKLAAGSTVKIYVSTDDTSEAANTDNNTASAVNTENSELIAKAQNFYEEAIKADCKFGRSAPQYFNIDTMNCFSTAEGRTLSYVYDITLEELRAQYHETFSDRYAENDATIDKWYSVNDGKLCWLTGNPGVDLYLESAKVTEVQRQTDEEIFFTVERHYSDFRHVDIDGSFEPYTETDDFSVVIQPDGSWKVGKFHNPQPN